MHVVFRKMKLQRRYMWRERWRCRCTWSTREARIDMIRRLRWALVALHLIELILSSVAIRDRDTSRSRGYQMIQAIDECLKLVIFFPQHDTPNTLSTAPNPVRSRIISELKLWYRLPNTAFRNIRIVFNINLLFLRSPYDKNVVQFRFISWLEGCYSFHE